MNLSKEKISSQIVSIPLDYNDPAEKLLRLAWTALVKAKKTHTNIRIQTRCDEGDDNTLPQNYLVLCGTRLESDEEWHKRLEHERYAITRRMEEAQRITLMQASLEQNIKNIAKALKKSPLKCVDCGCPESGRTSSQVTKGQSIRICNKCHEEREKKAGIY